MSDQLDHVERPTAPWRSERLTECGLDDRRPLITRAEFYDRVKAQGWGAATRDQQRAEFVDPWAYDPAVVVDRDLHGVVYGRSGIKKPLEGRELLNRELHVIALLVEAHRAEFDAALAGMDEATGLDALRAKRAARAPKAGGRSL